MRKAFKNNWNKATSVKECNQNSSFTSVWLLWNLREHGVWASFDGVLDIDSIKKEPIWLHIIVLDQIWGSKLNDSNTRSILAAPRAFSLTFDGVLRGVKLKQKSVVRYIEKLAAEFCPTFNIVLPCYTNLESDAHLRYLEPVYEKHRGTRGCSTAFWALTPHSNITDTSWVRSNALLYTYSVPSCVFVILNS